MAPEETTHLQDLLDQALPGPWKIRMAFNPNIGEDSAEITDDIGPFFRITTLEGRAEEDDPDLELIIAAVNTLPALLAENKRLRTSLGISAARLARISRISPAAYMQALAGEEAK